MSDFLLLANPVGGGGFESPLDSDRGYWGTKYRLMEKFKSIVQGILGVKISMEIFMVLSI